MLCLLLFVLGTGPLGKHPGKIPAFQVFRPDDKIQRAAVQAEGGGINAVLRIVIGIVIKLKQQGIAVRPALVVLIRPGVVLEVVWIAAQLAAAAPDL